MFTSRWPKGVAYEGVPDNLLTGAEGGDLSGGTTPIKRVYMGATVGQSVSLQSLDALLGVEHFPGKLFCLLSERPWHCIGSN